MSLPQAPSSPQSPATKKIMPVPRSLPAHYPHPRIARLHPCPGEILSPYQQQNLGCKPHPPVWRVEFLHPPRLPIGLENRRQHPQGSKHLRSASQQLRNHAVLKNGESVPTLSPRRLDRS